MTAGVQNLKHIVVVMMENRSFDHMLGSLKSVNSKIDGLKGNEFNLDTNNEPAKVQPQAKFQSQLDPDPDHHFPAVHKQIFDGGPASNPTMGGFVKSYWDQQHDVNHSREIMYYFPQSKLPVLTTLALKYAVFNGWFASIPGPTLCNRAFAHYGTSFGQVSMDIFYFHEKPLSVYQRLNDNGHSAKVYYYDEPSSSLEVVNLLQNQPALFGTYKQFLEDCDKNQLPQYCFIEPNYSDHEDAGGELVACDQHPDHDVQQGEAFLAEVYNKIRTNPDLWKSTAMLVLYDEHGGIYDHVKPPACTPDGFSANPDATGVPGVTFNFDRLGVRVPAILISPWVPEGEVVPGPYEAGGRAFEHASIPHTVTQFFIGDYPDATAREKAAPTFLDLLSDNMRTEEDCPVFEQE
jgi:phospholipase C